MMALHRAQNDLGEPGPEISIHPYLGLSGELLEIHAEAIGEAAAVQRPVAGIERAPEIQHASLDLRAMPEGFEHLLLGRCCHELLSCHQAVVPPSMLKSAPVTQEDSLDAR